MPISIEIEYSIRDFQNKRNKYLKKYRDIDIKAFPEETQDLLKNTGADNAIRDKMKPDSLAAVYKEENGTKIFSKAGKELKHIQKGREAKSALKNTIAEINNRLKVLYSAGKYESYESQVLRKKLSDISKIKDVYTELMQEAKCLAEVNKFKP